MKSVLLTLAAIGWLTSVAGAVLDNRAAFDQTEDPNDPGFFISHRRPRLAAIATTLIVAGASIGALGTILAVWIGN